MHDPNLPPRSPELGLPDLPGEAIGSGVAANVPWINEQTASRVMSRVMGAEVRVLTVRKLYGGSINRVMAWTLEGPEGTPESVVVKLHTQRPVKSFEREHDDLCWFREHTAFPVPEPIAVLDGLADEATHVNGLLMHFVPGVTLGRARLSARGVQVIQHDLARHVAELHRFTRTQGFGPATRDDGLPRWIDSFGPMIEHEFNSIRDQLSTPTRQTIDRVIHALDRILPEDATPTLCHGDLWANNILVDDAHPDRPRITGFIDGTASFCDPEYELAYLRVFQTATEPFFDAYRQVHRLRSGFETRCRVYWLNTMMLHVRVFGARYLPSVESLAKRLAER